MRVGGMGQVRQEKGEGDEEEEGQRGIAAREAGEGWRWKSVAGGLVRCACVTDGKDEEGGDKGVEREDREEVLM